MFLFHLYSKTIITTFSVLENFTKELIKGTKTFTVHSIVKTTDDPHTFVVTPQDYVTLSKADILVENGFGFEPWLPSMLKNVSFKGRHIIASAGIKPLRFINSNVYDPHAWHNVLNAKIYVENIAKTLIEADPENAKIYEQNKQAYLTRLSQLHQKTLETFKRCVKTPILTTHDAFWYFGDSYGVKFISPLGISTEEEPSSYTVARLISYIKKHKIKGALFEAHTNNNLVKKISRQIW